MRPHGFESSQPVLDLIGPYAIFLHIDVKWELIANFLGVGHKIFVDVFFREHFRAAQFFLELQFTGHSNLIYLLLNL